MLCDVNHTSWQVDRKIVYKLYKDTGKCGGGGDRSGGGNSIK
jgi:hypothetical protein